MCKVAINHFRRMVFTTILIRPERSVSDTANIEFLGPDKNELALDPRPDTVHDGKRFGWVEIKLGDTHGSRRFVKNRLADFNRPFRGIRIMRTTP